MSIPIDNFITTVIKSTVDTTGWTFIDFGDLDNESPGRWGELNSMITGYRTFLNKEAGTQDYDWKWVSGDRYARGVLIKDAEIALLFKLKFPK
jgi:hypothetical protein